MVSITRLNLLGDMGQGQPAHACMKKLFLAGSLTTLFLSWFH